MFRRSRSRARGAFAASALGLSLLAVNAPEAAAETIYIGARNCYDAFDTSMVNGVATPGAWVEQVLHIHVNWNIRNRCDPNSWVIEGTYTTGAVWIGGQHKANGGAWWQSKSHNGGWHYPRIGYPAPTEVGVYEMRAYILSSLSQYPTPSYYNAVARTWLEVVSAPTPPRNARASSYNPQHVLLQWDAPASDGRRGIAGYEIWRGGRVVATVGSGSRSFVDGPFTPGQCHTYFVKAWNSVGFSGGSNSTVGCAPPDVVAPNVVPAFERVADANGWYNRPVRIDWKVSDPAPSSGTPTVPPPTLVDRQGTHQYNSQASVDPAGNKGYGNAIASLDSVAPAVTPTVSEESAPGWHNTDTTVSWTCVDATSGTVACSDPTTVTEEGIHEITGTGTDLAANSASATTTVRLDRTPPATTHDAPLAPQPGDTTVTLDPVDNLAGVAATTYRVDGGEWQSGTSVPLSGDGVHTVEFTSTDNAGNVEPVRTVQVEIDTVAPTITPVAEPGATDGWNNTSVTVSWTCADDRPEGVVSCSDPVTLTEEGVHTVTGTVVDRAGNTTTASYDVRIDKTGPRLLAVADRLPDDGTHWYRAAVTVTWSCDDGTLSQVRTCPDRETLATEGEALTVTGTATDVAGNSTTATSPPYAIDLAAATASVDQTRVSGVGVSVQREVTGRAADTMSGVARVEVEYTPSNGTPQTAFATCGGCGALARDVTWVLDLPRGSYSVRARAWDVAGHTPTGWSTPVSVVLVN